MHIAPALNNIHRIFSEKHSSGWSRIEGCSQEGLHRNWMEFGWSIKLLKRNLSVVSFDFILTARLIGIKNLRLPSNKIQKKIKKKSVEIICMFDHPRFVVIDLFFQQIYAAILQFEWSSRFLWNLLEISLRRCVSSLTSNKYNYFSFPFQTLKKGCEFCYIFHNPLQGTPLWISIRSVSHGCYSTAQRRRDVESFHCCRKMNKHKRLKCDREDLRVTLCCKVDRVAKS